MTVKAVQRFQDKYNITKQGQPGYGIAGPRTRAKLNELYASLRVEEIPFEFLPQEKQVLTTEEFKAQIKLLQEQIVQLITQLIQMLQEEIKKEGS